MFPFPFALSILPLPRKWSHLLGFLILWFQATRSIIPALEQLRDNVLIWMMAKIFSHILQILMDRDQGVTSCSALPPVLLVTLLCPLLSEVSCPSLLLYRSNWHQCGLFLKFSYSDCKGSWISCGTSPQGWDNHSACCFVLWSRDFSSAEYWTAMNSSW